MYRFQKRFNFVIIVIIVDLILVGLGGVGCYFWSKEQNRQIISADDLVKSNSIVELDGSTPKIESVELSNEEKVQNFYSAKIKDAAIKDYSFFENEEVFIKFLRSVFSISSEEVIVSKGKFDWADRDKEVIIASFDAYIKDYDEYYKFIVMMDDKANLALSSSRDLRSAKSVAGFSANPQKILNNYPPFFIGNDGGVGGSCGNAGWADTIYYTWFQVSVAT
ncbi:MAG: hypothetical protein WC319_05660 [Candidatus Paceibacterota bacterium]|jgi:hypothetical protein